MNVKAPTYQNEMSISYFQCILSLHIIYLTWVNAISKCDVKYDIKRNKSHVTKICREIAVPFNESIHAITGIKEKKE